MPHDDSDSLDRDVTQVSDQRNAEREVSLGDQSTCGDAGSSISDLANGLGEFTDGLEIADLTSRYDVEGTIGRGGMGEVLLATDKRLRRKVAIKRIRGEMAASKQALSRFLTEARAVAALNHFNIVQVHDYGRDTEGPYIVMEFVDGKSLHDRLKEGPLPVEQAIDLSCQLCDALALAHERGIVHRDIKPANILLTSRGHPKLTDFGLARQNGADHGQTLAGAVLGTMEFMAPEQRRDATQADARSDLWSLAATLYQMITGEVPRVINLDDVPTLLRNVLSKAMKTKPDDRYSSADEFRSALRGAVREMESASVVRTRLNCPNCHTPLRVRAEYAGRVVSCKTCQARLRVSPDGSQLHFATDFRSPSSEPTQPKKDVPVASVPESAVAPRTHVAATGAIAQVPSTFHAEKVVNTVPEPRTRASVKRQQRTDDEVREIFGQYPDVKQLHDELTRLDGVCVQMDGKGECVFKVYLSGRTGPFESFLWVYKAIDKSQVGWAGQSSDLQNVCREIWSGIVLSPTNVNGSQLKRGVGVGRILETTRRYLDAVARQAQQPRQ